jgi:hypothetical protein
LCTSELRSLGQAKAYPTNSARQWPAGRQSSSYEFHGSSIDKQRV